ncbi:Catechol 2,3-dioxygenase [Candidatus Pantoea varia]|uniref:Phenazine antibiotic resistance protein n=1 Tax=Candidatus Pantoea varia TaxID=1881036 RepID=A0A1I5EEL1_9GAMM|nr:VOC family protein [Pantoea varia]SFO10038.1 Catechol 2,3-dioxygenase [Pantoea varia]
MIPNLIILYVDNPIISSKFYQNLFETEPDVMLPTWVAFSFDNGMNLGLWSIKSSDFVSCGEGNRTELSFMVNDIQAVDALYQQWSGSGVQIEQEPKQAVFGKTFVALDPDGHRIRVCIPDK